MRFSYIFCTVAVAILSLSSAQESCESLLEAMQETLEQTQTLTRNTKIKLGFIELASITTLVKQTPSGLEFVELERTGRERGNDNAPADQGEFEEGLLGTLDLNMLSCDGHKLEPLEDSYKLELVAKDEETSLQGLTLELFQTDSHTFIDTMNAQIKGAGMPVTLTMLTTFSDWQFED